MHIYTQQVNARRHHGRVNGVGERLRTAEHKQRIKFEIAVCPWAYHITSEVFGVLINKMRGFDQVLPKGTSCSAVN